MKPLTRLYDRLTADERLRLFIEAAARGDDEELDWINETCPRAQYEITDPAYVGRLRDLGLLARSHALELRGWAMDALSSLHLMWIRESDDRAAKHAKEAVVSLKRALATISAKREAWKRFCAELDLDGERVLRAFRLDPFGPHAALLEDKVTPEADDCEKALGDLRSFWARSQSRPGSS